MPISNGNVSNNGSGGGGGDNQFVYRGTYNAATNTPTLENGVGTQGDWYLVTVAGTNNPTGELLNVNQVIAYNGYIWEAGGQIDNTDEIVVAPDYIVIRGQTIQVGQSVTVALGVLEGEIADLSAAIANALNGKQNLVADATNDNLATLDATGQTKDSGIAKSLLTNFNGNSELVKTTAAGKLPGLDSGTNTTVNNPVTATSSVLNDALANINDRIPATQVQSNWNETNNTLPSYIQNKPTLFVNPMTASGDLIYGGTPSGGVAPPTRLPKGTANQILTINAALSVLWGDNPALYQYSKFRYVDNVGGSDTNIGSYNAPYKTMKYAVENNPTGMILVLMGQSTEAAFSIPANKTNIDIVAFGTRSALNGFTNKVTVLGTGAGSVRFQNINFGGGLTRDATCTCGIYLYGGSIGATGFTQSGNGYTEFVGCDASNGLNTITTGTFVVDGGKLIAPIVSGTGTFVSLNNAGQILGNTTVAIGSTFSAVLSIWVSASTGFALSNVANSVVLLDGVQYVRPDLATLSTISLAGNYSIQYTEFDKVNSVLTGTNLSSTDWFDNLGLLNPATVTGRTMGLVLDSNGKMAQQALPTGSAKSSLYLAGWGTDATVVNGNMDFNTSNVVSNIGTAITYSATNIALTAGKNYMVTVMVNSIQSGQPSASKQQMDYSGSTFTGANIGSSNGSINNNIYTCNSYGVTGSVFFLNAYNAGGNMNLFIPTATINPVQMAISPLSTSSTMYGYTQVASASNLPILVKDSTISSQNLTRSASVGGIFADNNTAFNHPFNGSNPVEYAACAGFNTVVVSSSLNADRFAFSTDNGTSFSAQLNPLANTVTMTSSLTACYAQDINIAMFVGTSGVSCKVDLTAQTYTQVNISTQGINQVVRGNLSGTMNFVAVGDNNTWNQILKSANGSSWLTLAANNLPSILPTAGSPVYSIAGVCQTKDSLPTWLVAVNDTANNKTYICSSSDLVTFSNIVNYSGFNVNGIFSEKISGVGITTGASAIFAYSTNTNGPTNVVIYNNGFWATPTDWKTVTNPANISGSQRGWMYPNGVFAIWQTGGTFDIVSTADGGNSWIYRGSLTSFTYMMPCGDYQLCSCSTVSASRKYSASYRNTYTTTILYNAMWFGGQLLQAGTSSTTTVTLSNQTIASYTDQNGNGPMQLTGNALSPTNPSQQYFKVGVASINNTEQVLGLYATYFAITNTFLYRINGTNCTVSGTTQAPGQQGDVRTCLQAQITNVNASAVINLNSNYNNGTNKLGGNNSISVQEI